MCENIIWSFSFVTLYNFFIWEVLYGRSCSTKGAAQLQIKLFIFISLLQVRNLKNILKLTITRTTIIIVIIMVLIITKQFFNYEEDKFYQVYFAQYLYNLKHECVSRGKIKKCSFFKKFGRLEIRPFALLATYFHLKQTFRSLCIDISASAALALTLASASPLAL